MLTDSELDAVTPEMLRGYLEREGWEFTGYWRAAPICMIPGRAWEAMICPAGMSDYPRRMRESLREIAAAERRPIREVYWRVVVPLAGAREVAERLGLDADRLRAARADRFWLSAATVGALSGIGPALRRSARREYLAPGAGACPAPWEVTR